MRVIILFSRFGFKIDEQKKKRLSEAEIEKYRFIQLKEQFVRQFEMTTSVYFPFS